MSKVTSFFFFLFLVLSVTVFAQVPKTLSYQGILTDGSGVPVPDGNYNITIRLYDVETSGTALWEEAQLVLVTDGVYNITLGKVVPLGLPFNEQYWLGVSVAGGDELTPRTQLTSSAYSLNKGVKIDGVFGSTSINVTTTTATEIATIVIPDEGMFDVSFSAYCVAEISGSGTGRYEFSIRRGSTSGDMVGRGWWRPGTAASLQAYTFGFTGIDKNVTGPVTYYLVARKFDAGAADALVFLNGFNATWVLD